MLLKRRRNYGTILKNFIRHLRLLESFKECTFFAKIIGNLRKIVRTFLKNFQRNLKILRKLKAKFREVLGTS